MDDKNIVRDLLLIALVAFVIWYIFRVEKRKNAMGGSGSNVAGYGPGTGSGASCGCGGNNPAQADYTDQLTSPGGPPLGGVASFSTGYTAASVPSVAHTQYSGVLSAPVI